MKKDTFGHWTYPQKEPGGPNIFGYVVYTDMVRSFLDDLDEFCRQNRRMELHRSRMILEKNGIDNLSVSESVIQDLDAQCVCALLVQCARSERFCTGALLKYFESGQILLLLRRLKAIDDAENSWFRKLLRKKQ